ncbi:MAG: tRNA (cytidine(56)-2'-O)-methyltransferase [Methanosaeta sp. PtaB.Bin018]|jgi:tRNA (cytidine56-2'-O)-methyltransferase|nr:MAG: tRNA (cytidine(56)-2'-O)-methyltransferase [Methanosaeta sp. PtaB.Bin018]OPY44234.1 MAG: tRNA (cytidine(56)-2'-O)-methyltransferase [Methanosaeta sp. PtaU1.Bin016]
MQTRNLDILHGDFREELNTRQTIVICMRVAVLRIGHRPERDKRITTHVGLVARAFGAEEMLLNGRDAHVEESLNDVVKRWGGSFRVRADVSWKGEVIRWREAGGKVAHLTMYGSNLPGVIGDIRKCDDILVVVGAEKVPAEMYDLADWNVAVGNQPHSEVAALAVFLDRLFMGKELLDEFEGGLKIVPSPKGKHVIYPFMGFEQ